jgi:CheY-like chemotaxis protein
MSIGILFIFALVCFAVDLAARTILRRVQEQRRRREREEALAVSLKLDFTREAKTLKRVEVKDPVASILCVDDEEVVLGSFRKILVLDGYSVDTVERGQEALGLIQSHHYDFVFTDLRMPELDGVEVVKAVKHMRPDIDVVIITGYATVDTAVECMKFGAMDYVQKPFTEEELRNFVKKALIKRRDRIRKQLKPAIHVLNMAEAGALRAGEFSIPGGALISAGHCWTSIAQDGAARVGLDDFAKKLIGRVDGIEFPNIGMTVRAGQPLFAVRQGRRRVQFHAPISGRVVRINEALRESAEELDVTPYEGHWVCVIDGESLDAEIPALKIGRAAVALFQDDIDRFIAFMQDVAKADLPGGVREETLCIGALERLSDDHWDLAARQFFGR